MKFVTFFVACLFVIESVQCGPRRPRKNVCKGLMDYAYIDRSPNCWYDPDVAASPDQIAKHHGFPFENYEIATKDGYILSIFRIPHNGSNADEKRMPVILQHGIAVDGSTWMLRGDQSPAFLLSNSGFDVWLPNLRGTRYSMKHLKYAEGSKEFWNFSFHEMGLYDLPAIIDFIAKTTGQKGQITYIGHSMGTTISYVYASIRSRHAKENIKTMISLAPVVYMWHVRTILRLAVPFSDLINEITSAIGIHSLGRNQIALLGNLCETYPGVLLCELASAFTAGLNADEVRFEHLPVFFSQYLSGLSLKTITHYGQLMLLRDKFQYFDYGPKNNLLRYNSTTPPQYKLSKINIPVHLFYGRKDFFSEEKDVYRLYEVLKTQKSITRVLPDGSQDFSHTDFVMGAHVKVVFDMVTKLIS